MPFQSLYIHVPFCQGGKCDYCSFYSLGCSTPEQRRQWLQGLERDFAARAAECRPLRSVFIGGGTPSSLTPEELRQLLEAVHRHFTLCGDCEWSMEANPESMTVEKLHLAASQGVNRLSLGVQSFQPALRQRIGRHGSLLQLPQLCETAHALGLRLNLDLIYAIPGESLAEWRRDLESALALKPQHLSCYSLITEEGTPLARKHLPPVKEELFLSCWQMTDEVLSAAGLHRYEVSNFAREGCKCRHNDEIWHGQSYLGCGPAAVSFDGADRFAEPGDFQAWLSPHQVTVDALPPEARRREIFAFAMRTVAGWSWEELLQRCRMARAGVLADAAVQSALQRGLAVADDAGFRPTTGGLLFNDDLLEMLL